MNKLSPQKSFELFKEECNRLIKLWGLQNWTFNFTCENKDKNKEFKGATIQRNAANLQADITFFTDDNKDLPSIKETAKHEILHCLIGELYLLGIDRYTRFNEISRADEALVHKLEALL